jgi:hypothetical protein
MKVLIRELIIRLTAFMMTMSKKAPFFAILTLSNEIEHEAPYGSARHIYHSQLSGMACNVDRSPSIAMAMSAIHLSIARGGNSDFAMLMTQYGIPARIFYSTKD